MTDKGGDAKINDADDAKKKNDNPDFINSGSLKLKYKKGK